MYVVMNRFTLHPGQAGAFETQWERRRSHLREVPGFVKFRLLRLDETHYASYVEWASREDFEAWTESAAFREAHTQASPQGVIAGPPQLERWEVVREEA